MYKTILHATDLEANHFELCQQALKIAKHFRAKLYLLHVISPPTSLQLAQSLGFTEFDGHIKEDAKIVLNTVGDALKLNSSQLILEIGSIKQHILQTVAAIGCELLIIGSHSSEGLSSLLGNTAHGLLNGAQCDVLTLRASRFS